MHWLTYFLAVIVVCYGWDQDLIPIVTGLQKKCLIAASDRKFFKRLQYDNTFHS